MQLWEVILLSALCLFVAPTTVSAQTQTRPQKNTNLEMLKDKLQLTDYQVVQIKSIYDEAKKKTKNAREEHKSDHPKLRETLTRQRNETHEQIRKILTDEQQESFDRIANRGKHNRNTPMKRMIKDRKRSKPEMDSTRH